MVDRERDIDFEAMKEVIDKELETLGNVEAALLMLRTLLEHFKTEIRYASYIGPKTSVSRKNPGLLNKMIERQTTVVKTLELIIEILSRENKHV